MNEIINQIRNLLDILESQIGQDENVDKNIQLLDLDRLCLNINNKSVRLTESECKLLDLLLNSKNLYCSYEELCKKLYNYNFDNSTNMALKTTMHRLRKKTKGMLKIQTIRNKGFQVFMVK